MVFNKKKPFPAAGACVVCGVLAVFNPLLAEAVASHDEQTLPPVEITGSYLPRTDTETPSPVQVINADELRRSGYTSISQVLQKLTANGSGALSQSFAPAFAAGASGISLRGLKTASTLVLIDGRRMAPYPLYDDGHTAFVDVSMLPFDAVERIEILKDGASATYGSDAIAGVINIILRKKYDGTQVTGEAGTTTMGGGTVTRTSLIHGFGNAAEGQNGYFGIEYRRQGDIKFSQRTGTGDWQNMDWSSLGGINKTPGVVTSVNPKPATLSPYVVNPNVSFSGAANSTFFFPGSRCSSFAQLSSGACGYLSPNTQVQPSEETLNLLGSFTRRLSKDWRLDVKASLFARNTEQFPTIPNTGGPLYYPQNFSGLLNVLGPSPTLVGVPIPAITIPASHPDNPFGTAALLYGAVPGAPVANIQLDSKAYRVVGELTGQAGQWNVNTALGYSRIATREVMHGNLNFAALNSALNRPVNPFRVNGPNSAADLDAIFPTVSADTWSDLSFVEVRADRSVGKLAGGDLMLGVGGGVYYHRVNAPAPYEIASGQVMAADNGNFTFASGKQISKSLWAELDAPVTKDWELNGSARYDNVDGFDKVTPKAGFKWAPNRQFALRGTLGTGFRAPSAIETNNSGQVFQAFTINDSSLCPGGVPSSGNIASGSVVSACNIMPLYLLQGNPDLKPERSTSATLGVILEPFKEWSTTIDLYRIQVRDQITPVASSSDPVRGTPVETDCADGSGGTVRCTPAVGPIMYFPSMFVNANSVTTSGFDLDTGYRIKLGNYGALTTKLQWNHIFNYTMTVNGVSYQLAGTHGPSIVGGNSGNPRDRVQLTLAWDKGPWNVTTNLNWLGGFDLTDPSAGTNDCAAGANGNGFFPAGSPPSQYCRVKSYLQTDLFVRYNYDKQISLFMSVLNLFNQAPPVDLNTWAGGNQPWNPSFYAPAAAGRFISMGATFKF